MSKKKYFNGGDAQFDAFMRESLSSDESSLDTSRMNRFLDNSQKKKKQQLWKIEDEDEDSENYGLSGTGKMFMKKKAPEPAARKEVNFGRKSRDSLDDESLRSLPRGDAVNGSKSGVPTLNLGIGSSASFSETPTAPEPRARDVTSLAAGKETLDEIAEKERFFKELERNRSTTVDYGRLNQELDKDGTMAFGGTLENTIGSDSIAMNHYDEAPSPAKVSNNSKEGEGMLSKVSLLDSLDSTMGSNKVGASKDREREMNTIHEVDSHNIGEGYDEPDATVFHDYNEDARRTDTEHTQGITLKTGTGLGYTNTSREIEALQDALKQVGLSTVEGEDYTLKDSSTMQGKSSVFATQKTQEGSAGSSGTPQFGLKPVVPPRSDRRTVDDILREAKESKPFSRDNRPSVHFKEDMESRGFDLSPVQSVNKTSDHTGALELSPISRYKDQDSTFNNSELDKNISVAQLTDVSEHHESTPIVTKKSLKKTPRDPFSHIKSSGYGQGSSQPVWSPSDKQKRKFPVSGAGEVKPPLKSSSSKSSSHLSKSSKPRSKSASRHPPSSLDSEELGQNPQFLQSVESFAQYLQSITSNNQQLPSQHTGTTNGPRTELAQDVPAISSSQKLAILEREHHMLGEVQNWQEILREEKKIQAKLRVELESKERDYERRLEQMKTDHDHQLFTLKQENYVLSAKITEEAASKKRSLSNGDVASHSEQSKLMEQEIKEQEKLLAGYQQENERIYQEMKKMQTVSKSTEEKMFKENQRLQNEVASLRDQLHRKEIELRNKGVITGMEVQQQIAAGNRPVAQEVDGEKGSAVLGANKISGLEKALREAMQREEVLLEQVETERKGKRELDARMEMVVSQMHILENRLQGAKQIQTKQDQEKHVEYEGQIHKLEKKLKWYVENQDLLDKDLQIIKKKDEEIKRLKLKLDNLQSETGRKTTEMRIKTKERSADAKRIQDLERQVREMEGILRKRHPNSLPVLMWAASTAPDPQPDSNNKSSSVQFLEGRIKRLEGELEGRDEQERTSVRALEQKYNVVKFQYEERISDLESRLSKYERPGDQKLKEGDRPHSHASALQKELDRARERHKKEGAELKGEIDRLRKEVQTLKNKEIAANRSEHRNAKEKESELELRVKALQVDHTSQEKDKQMLLLQIEQLKKEKQQLAIEASRTAGRMAKTANERLDGRSRRGRPKSAGSVRSQRSLSAEPVPLNAFSQTVTREKYDPGAFSGSHVSDLVGDNQQLRAKLERLELDHEQQRVMTSKVYAETEARERRVREEYAEKLQAIKQSHQIEVQRLLTEHAMTNSTSKLADVTGKLNTQEVMVRHLREQLTQSQVDGEEVAVLKIRETTLENQLKQLHEELREARKSHTPEMRHYESLQNKIVMLETRHAQREQELKHVITQTRLTAHADLKEEVDKWKQVVEAKNRETERFRGELDQILVVLRELQRQGVILPYGQLTSKYR